ncbi:MAG: 50S ribosomal protein L17 [Deltaproteobacteria bacterium]|nr:50S ribosomal protein L17 [Deltaproteobacteria bacterium]
MRHLKSGRKLNRSPSHRRALMRNLVTSLFRHERIQTTDPKAKELRSWADRVIGLGKQGTLHARRQALGIVQDEAVVHKVFDSLAPRYKDRLGGYTRIVKVGWRHGDRAPLSMVELMPADGAGKAGAPSGAKKRGRRPAQKEKEGAAKKKSAPRQSAKKARP